VSTVAGSERTRSISTEEHGRGRRYQEMIFNFTISTARNTLCLINFLCFLAGIGCLGSGIWMFFRAYYSLEFMHFSGADAVVQGFQQILQPDAFQQISYVLIGAGASVSVTSFLGWWGASRESQNFLICYGAILALILLLEITAGGMVASSTGHPSGSLKDSLKSSLTSNYVTGDKNAITVLWDHAMVNTKCCGVNGYEDFKEAKKFTPSNKKLPEACCVLVGDVAKLQPKFKNCTQEPSNVNSYWKNGCYTALMERTLLYKLMAVGVGVGLAVFQLLGIIFAFYFSGYILQEEQYLSSSSEEDETMTGLYH
jgi:hypothetical protein